MELTGGCLCGAVRFTAEVDSDEVGACHCSMCRRLASGPQFAVVAISGVRFEGAENISRYRSSAWAERAFCAACGTKLFYRLAESGQHVLCLGAFDDQERWRFVEQIFVDEKPGFYAFANRTRMLTGAEFVAPYLEGADKGGAMT